MTAILNADALMARRILEGLKNEESAALASRGTDIEKQSRDIARIWEAGEYFRNKGLGLSLYFGAEYSLVVGIDNANFAEMLEVATVIGRMNLEIIRVEKVRPIFHFCG